MSKLKRTKVQDGTTEKRLQFLMKEVTLQSQMIRQLAQLFKTTYSSRQQLKGCNYGHDNCNIDHDRFNFVKPEVLVAQFKSDAMKIDPLVSSKTASAEHTFIARLANKVDRLQYKYGAPNETSQMANVIEEFRSIWKYSNLLISNSWNQDGGVKKTMTFKHDFQRKIAHAFPRVKFIPTMAGTVPNFKAVNAINTEVQSRERIPVAAPSRDCNPVTVRSCNRPSSVQSSDFADSNSECGTEDNSDPSDSDGYSWDYNGCDLNEGCNVDRWNGLDSIGIVRSWHETIADDDQLLDAVCYQNLNYRDGEIENKFYEDDVFEPEESECYGCLVDNSQQLLYAEGDMSMQIDGGGNPLAHCHKEFYDDVDAYTGSDPGVSLQDESCNDNYAVGKVAVVDTDAIDDGIMDVYEDAGIYLQEESYGGDDYYLQEDACCIYLDEDAFYDPDPGDIYVG